MPDKYRVGIIGVGWGGNVHVPAFRLVPEYDVVALCGRRADRAAEVAARVGVPESASDWQALVRRDDLDIIVVSTPADLHAEMAIAAARAGKHVYCEKPVGRNAKEALAMTEAAEAAGVASAMGYEMRWYPERALVSRLITSGYLGAPHLAHSSQTAPMYRPGVSSPAQWKLMLGEGGGYVGAVTTHELDYLSWLFGEPEAVCAGLRTEFPDRKVADGTAFTATAEDVCAIMVRFASGALAVASGSSVSIHSTPYRFDATGSDGTICYTMTPAGPEGFIAAGPAGADRKPLELVSRTPRSGLMPDPAAPNNRNVVATALLLEDWLPALRGDASPVPTLRDGLRVQKIIDAARASSDGAGWVRTG
ncbi:MAG: Gfo/Idh/MocA family oxidoreductase [Dehalococcoidia bacterium]|nr:Gfo/Idh/MocA family oxidoreductase [Dehalococcoidia bacterium]